MTRIGIPRTSQNLYRAQKVNRNPFAPVKMHLTGSKFCTSSHFRDWTAKDCFPQHNFAEPSAENENEDGGSDES
jgi:hypothetical protein